MKRFLTDLVFIDSIHEIHKNSYKFIQNYRFSSKILTISENWFVVNPLVDTVTCVAGFRGTVNIRNIHHEHAQQSIYICIELMVVADMCACVSIDVTTYTLRWQFSIRYLIVVVSVAI